MKRLAVYYTSKAREDLCEIHDYIARRNPVNAERFIGQLEARCAEIGTTPRMGRLREELAAGLRSVTVGKYVLFYRLKEEKAVEILRVVHGGRDLETLL
jgi:toxin ParE1/3/4